jgi:hypothetical protein
MSALCAPSTVSALPIIRPIADYEAAFNARRRQLGILVELATASKRASLLDRILALFAKPAPLVVPYRTEQPRDGRGRFLSNAWRRQAEALTESDLRWFRSPIA